MAPTGRSPVSLVSLALLVAVASGAAGVAGVGEHGERAGAPACACPRGDDELQGWLNCIGLDHDERVRIADEGWMAHDFREMSFEDAVPALNLKRAKAWRITRCGKGADPQQGHGGGGAAGGAGEVEARGSGVPSPDETGDGCHINLYGGLYFPNYYFTLVSDLPAFCGCKVSHPKVCPRELPPKPLLTPSNASLSCASTPPHPTRTSGRTRSWWSGMKWTRWSCSMLLSCRCCASSCGCWKRTARS